MDYTNRVFSNPPRDLDLPVLVDADAPESPHRSISWKSYSSYVKRIAVGLRKSAGIKTGDCVGLLSSNDVYYWVLGDGVLAAGAIFCAMPTVPADGEDQLATNLEVSGVSWLFVSPEYLNLALRLCSSAKHGSGAPKILLFDPPGQSIAANGVDIARRSNDRKAFSDLLGSDESGWDEISKESREPAEERIALRMFSSGTTSGLKTVQVSHAALVTRIDAKDFVPLPGKDKTQLLFIHLSTAAGQMVCQRAVSGYLAAHITKIADDERKIIDIIQSSQISSIQLPPRTMELMTLALEKGTSGESLQSLNHILVGGASSYKTYVEKFAALLPPHIFLRTGYGSTEAGLIAMSPPNTSKEWVARGTVGLVCPAMEVRLIDHETLEEIPPSSTSTDSAEGRGEVCVRSALTFSSYYNNPEATEKTFLPDNKGGAPWLRTGDCGYFDSVSGQLALTGRFNEMFTFGLSRVIPSEVEADLINHMGGSISDAAITTTRLQGFEGEERPMAYVVSKTETKASTAMEVHEFVAGRVTMGKRPSNPKAAPGAVVFCDSIPRNAMKKIIRRKLKDLEPLPGSLMHIGVMG